MAAVTESLPSGAQSALALSCALLLIGLPDSGAAEETAAGEAGRTGERERRRAPPARIIDPFAPELSEDPSAFVTTIELDDFAGEAKSTEELLARAVGVQVRRFGGPGQLSEISIRGSSGAQVVVLLDGVRLNSALSGGLDLSTLPASLIERIEIQRGGGSAQVGSGAIGGVVNIVTRKPGKEPRSTARISGASFGTWEGALAHAQRVGPLGVSLGYDGFKTDGDWRFQRSEIESTGLLPSREFERVNNRAEHHATLLRLDTRTPRGLRLRAGNQFFYQSRGQPGFANGSGPFGGQSLRAHERLTRNVADVEVAGGEQFDWSVQGFHRYERTNFGDPSPPSGSARKSTDRQTTIGSRAALGGDGSALGAGHSWTLELDGHRDSLVSSRFAFVDRWVGGLQLQDEISFAQGRLRLAPGLRADGSQGFGWNALPRIGVVVEPAAWLRLKANAERSFRVPSFDELFHPDEGFIRGNPALRPERALNYDAGFEIGSGALGLGPLRRASLEASYFRHDVASTIVFTQINPQTIAPQNINDVEIDGIELAASAQLLDWAGVSGNWTRLWTRVAGSPGVLPGRAESEASLRLELGPESRHWKLSGEWHYVSRIPLSESGRSFVSERYTWDASLSVDLATWWPDRAAAVAPRALRLAFVGSNLADRSVSDAQGIPQPGRILTLLAEAEW